MRDIETPDDDGAAAHIRTLILQTCAQLRRGQAPTVDTGSMCPKDAEAIDELTTMTGRLARANASFTIALESVREAFAIFGRDLRIIYCNQSFRNFFLPTTRVDVGVHFQTLGDTIERYRLIDLPPDEFRAWRDRVVAGCAEPLTVRLPSGRTYRWHLRNDQYGNIVCVAIDLTREMASQGELEAANRKAQEAMEAKATFLTHMSHELRTPMNGVIGMAELLCDSGLDDERQRYAETIRNSAEALLEIINGILDYASGKSGDVRIAENSFDLEKLSIEVITLLQPAAAAKNLDLRLFFDPLTPARWIGDLGRLRQIIVNLVGNAVKYTPVGWVRMAVTATPAGVSILVSDNGPGIPDERIDSIFEEFSQLAEPGVTGISGTGLGLTITDRLVAAMGGHLWVMSESGEGSVFGVNLPLKPAGPPARIAQPGPRGTLLIVRDTPTLNRNLHRHLIAGRISYRMVADLQGARAEITAGLDPCVIVLFCTLDARQMPELAQAIRALAPRARLWLMIPAMRKHPKCNLFDRVITLPVAHADLIGAITGALENGPTEQVDSPQRRMRVLAADDNATNRLVIEKMLRHSDIELLTAADGRQALDIWQNRRPDLILMDISMPVMDGCEAASVIRQKEKAKGLPHTRIVAVTANAAVEEMESLLQAGLDDVVSKPVRRAKLLELLTRYAPADVVRPVSPLSVPT